MTITQALGGTYTVMGPGIMARIEGKDADALGLAATAEKPKTEASGPVNVDEVWEALKSCYDPEIPVNIVDLGLIYCVQIEAAKISITMTLTTHGCPMHESIAMATDSGVAVREIKRELALHFRITHATIEIEYDACGDDPERTAC